MIKQLYIKNYTLIDQLTMTLHPGFAVITGETGAGKSIILGAIGLLLGQRADSKAIKTGADRCTIEAHFDLSRYALKDFFDRNDIDYDATDCILRRELTAAGKSRAFINDTPVALQLMRELGEQLVDIHSQHQNLLLNKENFQLSVVDIIAGNNKQRQAYGDAFAAYRKALAQQEQLKADIDESRRNEDFLRFQCNELSDAHLQPNEQETLEQESETLSHAEEIKGALYEANNLLNGDEQGIVEQLRQTMTALNAIEHVYAPISDVAQRLDSSYIELKDIAQEIGMHMERIDFDPARLEAINDRLDRLYSLQQKHHVDSVDELLSLQQKCAAI